MSPTPRSPSASFSAAVASCTLRSSSTPCVARVMSSRSPRAPPNGAATAPAPGIWPASGLAGAQERGTTFIEQGEELYAGMVVGIQKRPGDIRVNVCREKKQSNVRSSTSDISVRLTPASKLSLEQSLDFIADDELLEVTPKHLRLRKRHLTEVDQSRARRLSAEVSSASRPE